MTRIVAGRWRGRRIRVPPAGTRPTAERVREAIGSTLTHELGTWQGVRVLDLYAGSGALGLEALSRGAAEATFVERDARAVAVIERNLTDLGGTGTAVCADVASFARHVSGRHYEVVLADPPYDAGAAAVRPVLAALLDGGALAAGSVAVVELGRRDDDPFPPGFTPGNARRYGDTTVWYGRPGESPDPPEE